MTQKYKQNREALPSNNENRKTVTAALSRRCAFLTVFPVRMYLIRYQRFPLNKTPWTPVVAQQLCDSQHSMEAECSLQHSQKNACGFYPQSDESSPFLPILFSMIHFNIILPFMSGCSHLSPPSQYPESCVYSSDLICVLHVMSISSFLT
jgi:hypothetical protein